MSGRGWSEKESLLEHSFIDWIPPSLGIYNSTNEIREGPTLMRLPLLIIKCLLRIVTTIDNG